MTRHDELDRSKDDALLARLVLDERPGPATRISSARAHALVDGAIDAVMAESVAASTALPAPYAPAAVGTSRSEQRVSAPLRWLSGQRPLIRALSLAAAALLVLAGGAAAAKLIAVMREPTPAPQAAPAQPKPRAAQRPTAQVAPPAPVEEPSAEPVAPLDVTREPRAARVSGARAKDAREHVLEDLLQQANRARADGEFREAAALYAEVYEGRPSSLSAYVALVAAASLELEHLDRPVRARKLFETALAARPKGALDLEARQGLVLALRDLGARSDEISALRKLIALHPSRPAAARARARLAELGE